ncbi:MAG: hypothetical protein K2O14_02720 [Oscillospiraceae bacterium]|nr:hypothetical protein [Oscillospiraceae bacterium]
MGKMTAQEERFGFQSQGKFTCTAGIANIMVIVLAAVWVLGIAFLVTDNPIIVAAFGRWLDITASTGRLLVTVIILAVWTAFAAGAFTVIIHGMDYYYEADDEKFMIYRVQSKGRRELVETLYYHDVLEVSYYESMFHRGFLVEIRTTYRTVKYRLVFTKLMTDHSTEGTPFYILEQRSGLRGEDKEASGWAP